MYQDPVALLNCLHLMCGSCAVEWLKQSVYSNCGFYGSLTESKPQYRSSSCPVCRSVVRGVRDSYYATALVDVYRAIAPSSSLCRDRADEIRRLRAVYQPRQHIPILNEGRLFGRSSGVDRINSYPASPIILPSAPLFNSAGDAFVANLIAQWRNTNNL